MFAYELAVEHKALFVVLEHRYYGDSQPFPDWSLENLRHLTVDNALADIAVFIDQTTHDIQQRYGGPHRKWVVVGGSYPGAMSAWFRYKYPHLAVGSLASSAVVHAITDYQMFDWQIANSTMKSGFECTQFLKNVTVYIDAVFAEGNETKIAAIKETMGAHKDMINGDFMFYVADTFVMGVQYGSRTLMCEHFKENNSMDMMANLHMVGHWASNEGVYAIDYCSKNLRNTTIDV